MVHPAIDPSRRSGADTTSSAGESLRRSVIQAPPEVFARFAPGAPAVVEFRLRVRPVSGEILSARIVPTALGIPVPGLDVRIPADRLPEALPAAYPNVPPAVVRSDPHVSRAISLCNGRGSAPLVIFLPLPASLQPQLDLGARPQAPVGDREPSTKHAALERPRSSDGASIKRESPTEKPAAARERLDAKELLDPSRMAPRPTNAEPPLLKQHDAYVQTRGQLQNAVARAESEQAAAKARGAPEVSPELSFSSPPERHDGVTVRDARTSEVTRIPERLIEQLGRLDGSAREFFARPGWQREASFQRAMLLSLFAGGASLEQAHTEIFQLFGGRMSIDVDQLSKLAASYGLTETPQQALDAKQVDAAQAAREAQEKALLKDKVKTARTPEEMLLAQQQAQAVTGGKKKLKGTLDRVEGVGSQREEHAGDDGEDEEATDGEEVDPDEETNPRAL